MYPLLLLYIAYGIYIVYLVGLPSISIFEPLLLIVLTPVSYMIFKWAAKEQKPESDELTLDQAWEVMEFHSERSRSNHIKGNSLSELYESRIQHQGISNLNTSRHHNNNKSESHVRDDVEDEETFVFVPKKQAHEPKPGPEQTDLLETVLVTIAKPWEVLLGIILPHNKYPGISFLMIVACCFGMSDVQLQLADSIIRHFGFDAKFIALTFYNFFSNMPDLLTVISAARKKEFNLALTTIFSSQVINLQVSLCVPWFFRCLLWGNYRNKPNDSLFVSMAYAVVILGVISFFLPLNKYRLNLLFGIVLIALYCGFVYVAYSHRALV